GGDRGWLHRGFLSDAPGDAGRQHDARRGPDANQPAMPARRTATHGAPGFAQHRTIEAPGRFATRKLAIQRAELAVVVTEQPLEVAVGVARQAHGANLARIRASA